MPRLELKRKIFGLRDCVPCVLRNHYKWTMYIRVMNVTINSFWEYIQWLIDHHHYLFIYIFFGGGGVVELIGWGTGDTIVAFPPFRKDGRLVILKKCRSSVGLVRLVLSLLLFSSICKLRMMIFVQECKLYCWSAICDGFCFIETLFVYVVANVQHNDSP